MDIREVGKNLGIRHNVSFRVIDSRTGKVVSTHKGHNAATNSLLVGIGHYLKGDGVLNQGWSMLSAYVPRYISLGTMGLLNQEEDENGLPAGIGERSYVGHVYGELTDSQLESIGKRLANSSEDETEDAELVPVDGRSLISDEDAELLRYIDYLTHAPGFGADGYDPNLNNGRKLEGLGPMFADRAYASENLDDLLANKISYKKTNGVYYGSTHVNHMFKNGSLQPAELVFQCSLGVWISDDESDATSTSGHWSEADQDKYVLTVKNIPQNDDDIVLSGRYVSDGVRIYLYPPDGGLPATVQARWDIFESSGDSWWRIVNPGSFEIQPNRKCPAKTINCELISPSFPRAQISFRDVVPEMEAEFPKTIDVIFSAMISTGALAQFREPGKDYVFITEAGLWAQRDWISGGDNGLLAGYRIAPQNNENWDMSVPENRRILKDQIIKVKKNQVVQVIWKIQLGGIDQFEGIESLYPSYNRMKWEEWVEPDSELEWWEYPGANGSSGVSWIPWGTT